MAKTVKKLKDGDQGYDPDTDKFEVTEEVVTTKVRTQVYSLDAVENMITAVKNKKVEAIKAFDKEIEGWETLRDELLAES